jgi:hypothetical protein
MAADAVDGSVDRMTFLPSPDFLVSWCSSASLKSNQWSFDNIILLRAIFSPLLVIISGWVSLLKIPCGPQELVLTKLPC